MKTHNDLVIQALRISIGSSSLSIEFKSMAEAHQFKVFGDVVNFGVGRIPELPHGNYRILVELLGWLEQNGLLELADKIQEVDS